MLRLPLLPAAILCLVSMDCASEPPSTGKAGTEPARKDIADEPAPGTPAPQPARTAPAAKDAPASEAFKFPWVLDHEYRLIWVVQRTQKGESSFRISEVEIPTGGQTRKLYLSKSRYSFKKEGITQEGRHETYYDRSWKPVRYTCHHEMSGLNKQRSRQDHTGEVQGGRLVTKIVHNHDEAHAVHSEMDAPPEAYLFLNQAMDNWAILVGDLLRGPASCGAKVMYPDLLKVYDLRFTFEKEEPVELGKGKKPVCRLYSFRDREGQYVGKVWLNREGRMVLHEQGDLRVYLED